MATVLSHALPGPSADHLAADLYVDRTAAPQRLSYATYFNGFPAGYWSQWTDVNDVSLTVKTRGTGTVEIFQSDPTSRSQVMQQQDVAGDESITVFTFPLTGLEDGGWLWFDLLPDQDDLELVEATWATDSTPRTRANASIGITTFNKPDYCVGVLSGLAGSPQTLDVLDRIYVVDQGTQRVREQDGFDEVAAQLGDTLQVIEQPNLGGSGGFSRSMLETLEAGTSGFTLLLDDDVEVEPEAIYRLVQFGRFTTKPTIVGGHMLDLLNPTVLHAWAEVIDRYYFIWKPGPPAHVRHNFSDRNLRAATWAHRRDDADYTGWWMCLIPTETMREVGLSLPAFIKWDDAEYSVRAREAVGTRTVSLPGSALWHVAWGDKDDAREWQAYFHARNRLVAGLLHSPYRGGEGLIKHLQRIDVKHLLSLEYYAAYIRALAYRDILKGPEHLHAEIGTILGELRALRGDFVENTVYATPQEIPDTVAGRLTYDIEMDFPPPPKKVRSWAAKQAARHWLRPSPDPEAPVDVELARRDATWWRMPRFDSVLVTNSPRTEAVIYRRDREFFRAQLMENRAAIAEVARNWDRLAEQYRAARSQFTSPEAWRTTLNLDEPPTS